MKNELPQGQKRAGYVQSMFGRVASHYDKMNRLMTGGQDRRWRTEAIHLLKMQTGQRLLDLGTGTGDLAREAVKQCNGVKIAAGDFTLQMMLIGQKSGALPFLAADALQLPFENEIFDGVVSGFLMRNVGDLDQALKEQLRILKPGGQIVILETTPPRRNLYTPLIWLHMHIVIPLLGAFFSDMREAYQYLPNSSEQFSTAEALANKMVEIGFTEVRFKRLMVETIALHWAKKR